MASPEYNRIFGREGMRKSFGRARMASSSWRIILCFSEVVRKVAISPVKL